MVQANTPGKRDGRIAFWVEGKLVGDFPGLRLRDAAGLKANRIGLGLYTHNNKVTKTCRMWFDDVVVATEYIGPMTPVILTAQP
jgi:alkylation response protein AidB-like acyl-CoA dehydrogenase